MESQQSNRFPTPYIDSAWHHEGQKAKKKRTKRVTVQEQVIHSLSSVESRQSNGFRTPCTDSVWHLDGQKGKKKRSQRKPNREFQRIREEVIHSSSSMESRQSNGFRTPYRDSVWHLDGQKGKKKRSQRKPNRKFERIREEKYTKELERRVERLQDEVYLYKELYSICKESMKLREENESLRKELMENKQR